MTQLFRNIKGTFDVLPHATDADGTHVPSSAAWRFVEDRIHEVMARYAAHEIRTPMLEQTELVARGVGELTDIVSKEMFSFQRGDANYVLRPEITAPVMRAYLQHHLGQAGGTQRLYYVGPCFRAERPQKGRYRQFHQFGLEVVGADAPAADAETIMAMVEIYRSLGIVDARLKINTLGDGSSRPRYGDALRKYFEPHAAELTDTSLERLQKNPLRILDTKVPLEQQLLSEAPRLIDFVDDASKAHFESVLSLLSEVGVDYEVDTLLVRGLDYYTRTAFELESDALGAQSALAGGGRYDLLATEIGSKSPIPAVGFAAGFERLFLALSAAGISLPAAAGPVVFVVALGQESALAAFRLAQVIREAGVSVAYDLLGRSMKAQMREANRSGARFAAIIGKDELDRGIVSLKDLMAGEQHDVALEDVASHLNEKLS